MNKLVDWTRTVSKVLLVFAVSVMGATSASAKAVFDPALLGKPFADSPNVTAWGPPPLDIGQGTPDFQAAADVARGAAGQQAQLATVIITGEHGFGSGALISPDGWILTNYHVIGSVAQLGSITGVTPIRMTVVTCEQKGNRVSRREKNLSATLYRADPVHDLALLKLDSLPTGLAEMPHFKFSSTPATAGDPCMSVGSQGDGLPWAVRTGSIAGVYSYPAELTNIMAGADPKPYMMDRNRLTLVMSTCAVSGGDSGGPLLNMDGELIGLTFATPTNDSRGSVGYHVELADIRGFIKSMPGTQEPTPFDAWEAGFPGAFKAQPELLTVDAEGKSINALRYIHFAMGDSGNPIILAQQFYMDFAQRSPKIEDAFGVLPVGLWGMEKAGKFRFDLFVTVRPADGVLVTGYPNATGTIDEMRIDIDADLMSDLVWTRGVTGSWSHMAGKGLPLVAKDRLQPLAYRMTTQMLQSMLTGNPAEQSSGRKP